MKLFFVLSKHFLILIFLLLILFVLVFGQFSSYKNDKNALTHKNRVDFISNLGYDVNEETVSEKKITIPYKFSDVYNNYNNIQKKAGYDLGKYRGKSVILYSYESIDNDNILNLLVYDGVVIGGDICTAKINGEMLPLVTLH